MTRSGILMLSCLGLAVILSAVEVVHVKYLTRIHFAQLQDLRAQRDAIDVEWNRLRLEEAALSTHARVERKARNELGMFAPRLSDVLLIEEGGHGQR
ncbi:cell division protein FtsL [Imhoffiella purpurea]|uniref:Cell division protein FtsL n=1 Tax=Imhoffiella purpurea TaxID=1249627 RepID=W9V7T3_9GAMM|nr:cell division protein FtsL [Imhoffiella purpurea]EXJ15484.1 cell division protein [Imhoffiella purpurea]